MICWFHLSMENCTLIFLVEKIVQNTVAQNMSSWRFRCFILALEYMQILKHQWDTDFRQLIIYVDNWSNYRINTQVINISCVLLLEFDHIFESSWKIMPVWCIGWESQINVPCERTLIGTKLIFNEPQHSQYDYSHVWLPCARKTIASLRSNWCVLSSTHRNPPTTAATLTVNSWARNPASHTATRTWSTPWTSLHSPASHSSTPNWKLLWRNETWCYCCNWDTLALGGHWSSLGPTSVRHSHPLHGLNHKYSLSLT